MSYNQSILVLKDFLASELCSSGFNIDHVLGIMVATLSCSEYISDVDITELVVGNLDKGFEDCFEKEDLRLAWVKINNELGEKLAFDEFSLTELYPLAEETKEPSQALCDWCDGYMHGYYLTNEVWQADYDLMSAAPDFEEAQNIIDDCEANLNLIATLANWQVALEDNEQPEELKNSIDVIYVAVAEGVVIRYKLALLLEEINMDSDEFYENIFSETYIRDTPKIGRNDLCPCGSGKKIKKCCLN